MRMFHLVLFSHAFASALLVYGFLLHRNTSPEAKLRWLRFPYWLGALIIQVGMVMWPLVNLGRNIALAKFNNDPLWLALIGAGLVTVFAGVQWLVRKSWRPGAIWFVLALVQVLVIFLLMFYYSRA